MTRKILTHYGSVASAKKIRDLIEAKSKRRVLITSNPKMVKKGELLFRYGNSELTPTKEDNEFNGRNFILLCSNKLRFSRLMNENNFPSPQFFRNNRPNQYPIIIRTAMTASGGRGIFIIEDEQEFRDMWSNNFWWCKFYPTNFEIRAHVFLPERGGTIIPRIFRKVGNDALRPIRTNDDYHYHLKRVSRYTKAVRLINGIADLLRAEGGKFFALDMGYSPELRNYIMFEANSAPGLNDNSAKEYANFLINEGVIQ